MQPLEFSGAVWRLKWSLGVKWLILKFPFKDMYFTWSGFLLLGETEHGEDYFHICTVHLDIISTVNLDDIKVIFIHQLIH